MNEFEIASVINRPADEVFAALCDFDKAPLWNPGLNKAQRTSEGALGVGSTMTFIGSFLGRSFESPAECTEFVANKKYTAKSTSEPFHLENEYTFEPADGGTRLSVNYVADSRGFFKLGEPIVLRLAKKHFETAMENFKEMLEAGAL